MGVPPGNRRGWFGDKPRPYESMCRVRQCRGGVYPRPQIATVSSLFSVCCRFYLSRPKGRFITRACSEVHLPPYPLKQATRRNSNKHGYYSAASPRYWQDLPGKSNRREDEGIFHIADTCIPFLHSLHHLFHPCHSRLLASEKIPRKASSGKRNMAPSHQGNYILTSATD